MRLLRCVTLVGLTGMIALFDPALCRAQGYTFTTVAGGEAISGFGW
jgi:hypothetical protein